VIVDREYLKFAGLEIIVPKVSMLPGGMLCDGARCRVGIMIVGGKGGCDALGVEE
jgi:hypothetical protein